ncbi:MAG: YheV family putative metal-binding protein [Pseudomonadales bacterium]|nr:YheV family putative metal-binding protein [Pseudomonadales bacterium]MCP5183503.1 YheV family putative metal-binding protein [Pseudomonadales bacterium]
MKRRFMAGVECTYCGQQDSIVVLFDAQSLPRFRECVACGNGDDIADATEAAQPGATPQTVPLQWVGDRRVD